MKSVVIAAAVFCMSVMLASISFGAASHEKRVKGPLKNGPEVTKQCLKCHKKQAKEFMKTVHWTWETVQNVPGHTGKTQIGKKTAINNFCIAITSNWPRCTSCHAGYGWKDASFDFSDATKVDCLICHDTTGKYKKNPKGAGMPKKNVDLLTVAQNVGKPNRKSCGGCHFFGGGGDRVKHGDLDTSLIRPKKSYDVHMGTDGANMVCQACHKTTDHDIPGQAMSVSVGQGPRVGCTTCHGAAPHRSVVQNKHAKAVACQTCHIPTFAKDDPTKVWWDWSKAGDKKRMPEEDEYGMDDYSKKKGEFKWQAKIVPTYAWYNGMSERYIAGDKINPKKIVALTNPMGSINDKNAKIYPFKVMRGKQPYDAKNKYLIVPHVFGGYWKHFDWDKAFTDGMKAAGLKYSGKYGFVETKMYWRTNHMVVPKDHALTCNDCHGKKGRLDWKALGYKGDPRKVGGRTI